LFWVSLVALIDIKQWACQEWKMRACKYFFEISLRKHQVSKISKGKFICEEALAVADVRSGVEWEK